MAGPSESVLMHKLLNQHLLPFQRENPRSNEWFQASMSLYVRPDKWTILRRYNTGDYARLDAEDREYDQYQKARN